VRGRLDALLAERLPHSHGDREEVAG